MLDLSWKFGTVVRQEAVIYVVKSGYFGLFDLEFGRSISAGFVLSKREKVTSNGYRDCLA